MLLDFLDTSRDGYINFSEFLVGIRGQPNEARQAVIKQAFDKFDTYSRGVVVASELEQSFCANDHPGIKEGTCTINDVFIQFLATFGDKFNDGTIAWEDWCDHYAAVSAQVQSDDVFCSLMRTTWQL